MIELEVVRAMHRPKLEVADVFRRYGAAYREKYGASMSTAQRRVMSAIELCRSAALVKLGGHLERCDECGHERNCFNSCRDRHCPKCQSLARLKMLCNGLKMLCNMRCSAYFGGWAKIAS